MIAFPNCKINLGLHIAGKRSDGYHNLETVFYPVGLRDVLEVIGSREPITESVQLSLTGLTVEGDVSTNLCIKAYNLLKQDYPQIPAVHLYLHKAIPAGAGLGGGSADASFTLKLLNEKYGLNIPGDKLQAYALQLGSDCPFFLTNTPCLATGRGEKLEPITIDLSAYSIVIIYAGIHVSTAWAFSQLTPAPLQQPLSAIIQQPVESWRQELKNDFEKPVFNQYPELKDIKEKLYTAGAVYASMSGSGSAVYGLFKKDTIQADLFYPYKIHILNA